MKPLTENRAGRLLHFLAEAVFHHPRWFCYTQLLLVLVCLGYTVTTLQFSTDRNDLISVKEVLPASIPGIQKGIQDS